MLRPPQPSPLESSDIVRPQMSRPRIADTFVNASFASLEHHGHGEALRKSMRLKGACSPRQRSRTRCASMAAALLRENIAAS